MIPVASLHIGCAGWNVPKSIPTYTKSHDQESEVRSHLERYTDFFQAVEFNSSFHHSHLPSTYVRWRRTVAPGFRFSVKFPQNITHIFRLENCDSELERFIFEVSHLEEKLGILLIQIPPSLQFDVKITDRFLSKLRNLCTVNLALEPRNFSWFKPEAFQLLEQHNVALVWADPRPTLFYMADLPKTSSAIYIRLHGSPQIYSSSYNLPYLENLSKKLFSKTK